MMLAGGGQGFVERDSHTNAPDPLPDGALARAWFGGFDRRGWPVLIRELSAVFAAEDLENQGGGAQTMVDGMPVAASGGNFVDGPPEAVLAPVALPWSTSHAAHWDIAMAAGVTWELDEARRLNDTWASNAGPLKALYCARSTTADKQERGIVYVLDLEQVCLSALTGSDGLLLALNQVRPCDRDEDRVTAPDHPSKCASLSSGVPVSLNGGLLGI